MIDQKITTTKRKKIIFFILIFVTALFIRTQYNANTHIRSPIISDAKKYVTIAQNLVSKGIYTDSKSAKKSNYSIAPGYPFFLATVIKIVDDGAKSYKTVLLVQAIMGALTAGITFYIAAYFLPTILALCAGTFVAFSPHLISLGSYVLTETLFTFFLALSTLALVKSLKNTSLSWMIFAGILFGATSLVRPVMLLFPLVVTPLILLYSAEKKWRLTITLLVSLLIICGSWSVWTKANENKVKYTQNMALLSLAFGIYPDFTYKNPKLKGYPYRDDKSYNKFSRDLKSIVTVLKDRAEKEPWKYFKWYAFGKAATFWSPDMIVGQGGIYVYSVARSLYDTNKIAALTLQVMQKTHTFILFTVSLGFLLLVWSSIKYPERRFQLQALSILFAMLFYVTAVHVILAPLPRYSIPFRVPLYLAFCSSLYLFTLHSREIASGLIQKFSTNKAK